MINKENISKEKAKEFYCELINKDECRQIGVQCPECKKFEETWNK